MQNSTQIRWTADTIMNFLQNHADELKAMGVVKIGLFGSYVRDEQTSDSDIDFLLKMESWTWKRWCRVWDFMEDHLGVAVDLVPEENLRPELHAHVLTEVRYAKGF
jgi:predicted nucleotidyltransferase